MLTLILGSRSSELCASHSLLAECRPSPPDQPVREPGGRSKRLAAAASWGSSWMPGAAAQLCYSGFAIPTGYPAAPSSPPVEGLVGGTAERHDSGALPAHLQTVRNCSILVEANSPFSGKIFLAVNSITHTLIYLWCIKSYFILEFSTVHLFRGISVLM